MHGNSSQERHERSALIAGVAAFTMWGIVPIYWKLLKTVPAQEILAHRFVWTSAFTALLLTWRGRWHEIASTVRSGSGAWYCLATGSFISLNWLLFIWAVNAGHIIETSLGYFMTPLVNVLFGRVFLRERLTRPQLVAVLLALGGVLNLTLGYGRLPWVALTLCTSWGIYGLLRKKSGVPPIPGLFLETALLMPIALIYLVVLHLRGGGSFGTEQVRLSGILMLSGVITGLPLLWFAHAAHYLRLTTVGFLQYLAPTGTFFLGVFMYHEPFTRGHLITFVLIWIGLAIFTGEALVRWRSLRANVPPRRANAATGTAALSVR